MPAWPTGADLEAPADRLDDQPLGALEVLLALGQQPEDPAGEQLLDRAVEGHRGEARFDLGLEDAFLPAPC